jgi:alkyl hydroperoxide reductase subunit AhpF
VDERNATNVPGLFAAGDVTTSFGEQTMIAIGDGARAALSAYDYLLARQPTPRDGPVD